MVKRMMRRSGDAPPRLVAVEPTKAEREDSARVDAFSAIDLRDYRQGDPEPTFSPLTSQAVGAAQFAHPDYVNWAELLGFAKDGRLLPEGTTPTVFNRKVWEWAYVLQAAKQYDRLRPGMTAVGFGVGNEPVPAVLARYGMTVVATDQDAEVEGTWEAKGQWEDSGHILREVRGLYRPWITDENHLARHVSIRRVDMNEVPDDLGPCDLVWSSCAMEHLGSPEAGLEFVLASARLLAPGGVAAHTTEADLTYRETTADWGHLACYRPADFLRLADRLVVEGFETTLNLHVPMEHPADRWVSVVTRFGPDLAVEEAAHLKLVLFESVCTSFGLLVHRPG